MLFTDGLQDQRNPADERYGEARVLDRIEQLRDRTPQEITERVFHDLADFGGTPRDDRTLLVLRM